MPKDSDLESPFADVRRYTIHTSYHYEYYAYVIIPRCSNRDSAVFVTDDLDSVKMT